MKNFIYFILGVVFGMVVMWLMIGRADRVRANDKIDLCHWESWKYGWLSVDINSTDADGHGNHFFDIIPSYHYDYWTGNTHHVGTYPGKNLSKLNWIANDCKEPPKATPTPTVTLTPTPTPTLAPSVTPTPSKEPCREDCDEVTPTPTPTKEPEEKHEGDPHVDSWTAASAPRCQAINPEKAPCNFVVARKGDDAKLHWEICGTNPGSQIVVYYKQNGVDHWQYSTKGPNSGLMDIHGLGKMDITFAAQFLNGDCSGGPLTGPMTKAVVDDAGHHWKLWR